jgi:hypothetical protein
MKYGKENLVISKIEAFGSEMLIDPNEELSLESSDVQSPAQSRQPSQAGFK